MGTRSCAIGSLPLENQGGAAMTRAERATGAMDEREAAIRHLHLGMGRAAQLPRRFDDLGHAAAIGGMVVAQAAAIGVERQLADSRNEIAIGDEGAAFALLAKAEILERDQHRDSEAVIDRGILNI